MDTYNYNLYTLYNTRIKIMSSMYVKVMAEDNVH